MEVPTSPPPKRPRPPPPGWTWKNVARIKGGGVASVRCKMGYLNLSGGCTFPEPEESSDVMCGSSCSPKTVDS